MANKTVDQLTTFSGSMADDDLLPIFDTSESSDEKLKGISVEDLKTDLNFPSMDPSALGNWVSIREISPTWGIASTFNTEDIRDSSQIRMMITIDSSPAITDLYLAVGDVSGWDSDGNNYDGSMTGRNVIVNFPTNGELTLDLIYTIETKTFTGVGSYYNGSTISDFNISCRYKGSKDPTRIFIQSYKSGTVYVNGTAEIYQWQEVKPIELHSYELVKEYNLNNEILDDEFDWDGESDPDIRIISSMTTDYARLTVNGVTGGTDYSYGNLFSNGTTTTDTLSTGGSRLTIGYIDSFFVIDGYLKQNEVKFSSQFNETQSVWGHTYVEWAGSDPVTSIRVTTDSNATGNIKIYKLAKTHLFNQTIYNDLTLNVTTTGSDTTGDGTSQKPFASIHGALNWLRNKTINNSVGVTIKIADGTYNNQLYIVFDHISNAIQIEGNTTTPGNVILNFATGQPGIKTFKNSYLTLSGMTLNGFANAEWKTAIQAHYGGNVTIRDMVVDGWGVGMQAYQNGFMSVADSIVNDCNYGVHANAVSSIEYENGTISNCTSYGTLSEKLSRIVTVSTTYTSNATDNYNGTGGQTQVS